MCGKEAAHLMRELSKSVVASVLTHDCGKMKDEPKLGDQVLGTIDGPKEFKLQRQKGCSTKVISFILLYKS